MRRLNYAILASLPFCAARQPSFSIHDDLLAYPQFEIIFSNDEISEAQALAFIDNAHPTYSADFPSQSDLASNIRESTGADTGHDRVTTGDGASEVSETYEIMNFPGSRYLCSIPVLAPPEAQNQTATDLAKAEEARELARAATHGWQLMNELEGQCLYFMSGWWSYSFCYGKEIVQFHALPAGVNSGVPPVRDPKSLDYVLGRVPDVTDERQHSKSNKRQKTNTIENGKQKVMDGTPATTTPDDSSPPSIEPPNSELAIKDNQRYLVQKLGDGTICDLTGRPRTIEVQYHCHPGALGDRIGWIKEVTTCTYLMVVQTPRLCQDVAFMPPKEGRAHPITCHRIDDGSKAPEHNWLGAKGKEAGEGVIAAGTAAAGHVAEVIMNAASGVKDNVKGSTGTGTDPAKQKQHQNAGLTIGGVVIGGRTMLEEGTRLPPPRNHMAGGLSTHAKTIRHILAKGKGANQVETPTGEQLQGLELDPKAIDALKKEIQDLAGDDEWTLELVEVPGGVNEIMGIIGTDDDRQEYVEVKKGDEQKQKKQKKPAKGKGSGKEREDEEQQGSEETFKERAGA